MKTSDLNTRLTSTKLNENMFKKFGVKINLEKYTREQLEDARNQLRTKISQTEGDAGFNELLADDIYQKDRFMLDLLNTRIKEMLGEAKLSEKAVSKKQQRFMGMVHAAQKKGGKASSSEVAKVAKTMKKKDAKDFASTKHKGLPEKKKKKTKEGINSLDRPKAAFKNKPNPKTGEYDEWKPTTRKDNEIKTNWSVQQDITNRNGKIKAAAKKQAIRHKEKPDTPTLKNYLTQRPPRSENLEINMESKTMKKKMKKDSKKADKKKIIKKDKKKVPESLNKFDRRAQYAMIIEGLKRFIAEDEEGKAKDITAGTEMVNDFTGWMQRIGQYQTKSMIELADNIRANFGREASDRFKNTIQPALQQALDVLSQSRETITRAVAELAGEKEPEIPMGRGLGVPDSEPGSADSMNTPSPDIDQFAASDAASGGAETAGREKRESREVFRARRLQEAHSIISKLAQ